MYLHCVKAFVARNQSSRFRSHLSLGHDGGQWIFFQGFEVKRLHWKTRRKERQSCKLLTDKQGFRVKQL